MQMTWSAILQYLHWRIVLNFSRIWIDLTNGVRSSVILLLLREKLKNSIKETPLSQVSSVRDLGVIVDCTLSFVDHIDTIVSRALGVLGFNKRNTSEFRNINAIRLLYCSLVRPLLEYCSILVISTELSRCRENSFGTWHINLIFLLLTSFHMIFHYCGKHFNCLLWE